MPEGKHQRTRGETATSENPSNRDCVHRQKLQPVANRCPEESKASASGKEFHDEQGIVVVSEVGELEVVGRAPRVQRTNSENFPPLGL